MAKFIAAVDPELLIKANLKAVADHEKYGSADVMVSIVTALGTDHGPDVLTAVSYRLRALANTMRRGEGGAWNLKVAGKDYELVNDALFRAAAKATLKEPKIVGQAKFDAKELLKLALEEAKSEGSA